jgi:hypothetical protein
MGKIFAVLFAALVLLPAGCGADEPTAGGPGTGADEQPPALPAPDPAQLYEANTMVLEDTTHGPMLCLGGVLESLPPQCGDVPAAGWDWSAVEDEERAGGTIWGAYHVVGTYDGTTFTVTDVGLYEQDQSGFETDTDFVSPCVEPAGGWSGLDQATQDDIDPATAYARSQPDYITSWVTHLEPAELEFGPVILNVVFTADRERHEAELRKLWGGPLCVVERDVPSARELARIRKEAEAALGELELRMLWSQGPAVEPVIEIGVIADVGGRGQAAFDARYGPGVIRVISALQPAS